MLPPECGAPESFATVATTHLFRPPSCCQDLVSPASKPSWKTRVKPKAGSAAKSTPERDAARRIAVDVDRMPLPFPKIREPCQLQRGKPLSFATPFSSTTYTYTLFAS